jgi:hypothetical protein
MKYIRDTGHELWRRQDSQVEARDALDQAASNWRLEQGVPIECEIKWVPEPVWT